jgi:nucleoside-diphosphate-sugar epimerase
MKILFTGGSSYISYWIFKELKKAGHEIVATFRQPPESYEGLKGERVRKTLEYCTPLVISYFGDEKFMEAIRGSKWDLFCHHAADATDLRSPDYDWLGALRSNTNNLSNVVDELKKSGCEHTILTGTFCEANEGTGTEPREALYFYGLAKTLTREVFRYICDSKKMSFGKFVIPISFGPYEDPKLCTYLVKSWLNGEIPQVKTPKYFRDNIHVSLLAKYYSYFVNSFIKQTGEVKINPSGYKELIEDFAKRVAREIAPRLGVECRLDFFNQTEFPEPLVKYNTDEIDEVKSAWNESEAWDQLAEFFKNHYSKKI